MGDTDSHDTENAENGGSLTPEEAYRLNKQEGRTQKQIAENHDISQQRVSQLVNAYDSGREAGIDDVKSNPEAYDLTEALADEPDDNNPYESTCPACGGTIPTPATPGSHDCQECGTTLQWDESEI